LSEQAKNGGVQGEEIFCLRAKSRRPARQRGAEQKIAFTFFDFARAGCFPLEGKGNFSAR